MPLKPIALTAGEPAGIGPDLCVLVARKPPEVPLIVIADKQLLAERAAALGVSLVLKDYGSGDVAVAPGTLTVAHESLAEPVTPGKLDPANSRYILRTLERAIRGCASGEFSALVTAPVHKGVINDAGIPFTGHTEFLAEKTASPRVVMMLTGAGMRVALATTHLALKDVPAAISRESLDETLRIIERDLRQRFGVRRPRILVAGLNPHAGESGHLGREEIEVIAPVLEKLRQEGFDLRGPLPADTLFNPERLRDADCILAMYHDQGLPVLKHASFGGGVNVTLGLPIIRTSVDHGTALELAATGRVDCGSLLAAIDLARQLAGRRQAA